MSAVGRTLAQWISVFAWLALAVLALWLFFFAKNGLDWLGAFLLLVVLDRALHFKEADKPLSELPSRGKVNLSEYLTPEAIKVLANAEVRSSGGTNFDLEVLSELIKTKLVRRTFANLGISISEFAEKLEKLSEVTGPEGAFPEAQNLARLALAEALKSGSCEIGVLDLLRALSDSQHPKFGELLVGFSLKPQVLRWSSILAEPAKYSVKISDKFSPRRGIPLPPQTTKI